MTTRGEIIAEARSWIDTRWQHQAALKGVACDCLGLIAGTALRCGLPEAQAFFDCVADRVYGRYPDHNELIRRSDKYMDRVPIRTARVGDVLVMKFSDEPQHFAFLSCAIPSMIIHAYAQRRKVVEHTIDEFWHARITHAYSLRGLTG